MTNPYREPIDEEGGDGVTFLTEGDVHGSDWDDCANIEPEDPWIRLRRESRERKARLLPQLEHDLLEEDDSNNTIRRPSEGDDTEGDDDELDDSHPNSTKWPEVFSNGLEIFSEDFYSLFPWARGIDPYDDNVECAPAEWFLRPSRTRKVLPLDENAETPPAVAFVNSLTSLELDDLPEDKRCCGICGDNYLEGEFEEMPLELPCEHVFGKQCISQWFSSIPRLDDNLRHDNCPLCRKQYITEKKETIDTVGGLAQLLRDANYLLTARGPLRLTHDGRRQWEGVKNYVDEYLQEQEELEQDYKAVRNERHDLFMVAMRTAVTRAAIDSRATHSAEALESVSSRIISVLEALKQRGIVAAFLAHQDNASVNDDGLELSEEDLDAELEAMPYDVNLLMEETYALYFAKKLCDEEADTVFEATPTPLQLVDLLRAEATTPTRQYVTDIRAEMKIFRLQTSNVVERSVECSPTHTWLEVAPWLEPAGTEGTINLSDGLRVPHIIGLPALLEIRKRAYTTHFEECMNGDEGTNSNEIVANDGSTWIRESGSWHRVDEELTSELNEGSKADRSNALACHGPPVEYSRGFQADDEASLGEMHNPMSCSVRGRRCTDTQTRCPNEGAFDTGNFVDRERTRRCHGQRR